MKNWKSPDRPKKRSCHDRFYNGSGRTGRPLRDPETAGQRAVSPGRPILPARPPQMTDPDPFLHRYRPILLRSRHWWIHHQHFPASPGPRRSEMYRTECFCLAGVRLRWGLHFVQISTAGIDFFIDSTCFNLIQIRHGLPVSG